MEISTNKRTTNIKKQSKWFHGSKSSRDSSKSKDSDLQLYGHSSAGYLCNTRSALHTCFVHADPQSLQDVLEAFVFGEVLQSEVDSDPQTRPHVSRRARHPPQLLLPDERVSELSVEVLQLQTQRGWSRLVLASVLSYPRESGQL